jgi:hypothetical protein
MRDMIIAGISVALAGFVYINSNTFAVATGSAAQNPAFFPQVLAGLLGLLGLILAVITVKEKHQTDKITIDVEAVRNVSKLMLSLIGYVIGILYLGFAIANVLFIYVTIMLLGGERNTALKLCIPISVALYAIFFWLFQIPVPDGILWKLGE